MTPPGRAAVLFASVDRAVFSAALAARLRRAGIDAPLTATERFAAGLDVVGSLDRDDLYWLARVSFVTRPDQIARFDRVFAAVFEPAGTDAAVRGQQPPLVARADDRLRSVRGAHGAGPVAGGGLPWATLPAVVGAADADPDDDLAAVPELVASTAAALADTPFDQLDDDEMRIVGAAIDAAFARWPRRRSRRRRFGRRGVAVALRPTMRRALRTGAEPVELVRLRPTERARRVVALLDVSGSMEPYARAYLHVMRGLVLAGRAEVFAFATQLTRITPALRHRAPDVAIARATATVGDRFGGTRLATSVGQLLRDATHASQARGGVVVIVSDGCDTDPSDELASRMARLHRVAHRVVWVNPRFAAPGYEPLVAGMAAALPFCDRVLPGHSLAAIDDVVEAIVGDVHVPRRDGRAARTRTVLPATAGAAAGIA